MFSVPGGTDSHILTPAGELWSRRESLMGIYSQVGFRDSLCYKVGDSFLKYITLTLDNARLIQTFNAHHLKALRFHTHLRDHE